MPIDSDEEEFFETEDQAQEVDENLAIVDADLDQIPKGSMAASALDQLKVRAETNEQLEKTGVLGQFREALGSLVDHPYLQDKETLLRFLRADVGNVSLATARMKSHLKWRDEIKPETVICRACETDPHSHYMHNIGTDKFKRPIIYSCYALAKDRSNIAQNTEHIVMNLEALTLHMAPGVQSYVWICDFHGYGIKDCNLQMGRAAAQLFSKHFPERVGAFIFVGAPYIFSVLWTQLRLLIDKRQASKVRFLVSPLKDGGKPLREKLAEILDSETLDWLIDEMMENRNPTMVPRKAWLNALKHHEETFKDGKSETGHCLLGPPSRLACIHVDSERRKKALALAQ